MPSVPGSYMAGGERPMRSANAEAQARHRAKRKAYINTLEQTLAKLQIAIGFQLDDVNALPSPMLKIRELEYQNSRLRRENDDLRRLLRITGASSVPPVHGIQSSSSGLCNNEPSSSSDSHDYDFTRRPGFCANRGYFDPSQDTSSNSCLPSPLIKPHPSSGHDISKISGSSNHFGLQNTNHNRGSGPTFAGVPGIPHTSAEPARVPWFSAQSSSFSR